MKTRSWSELEVRSPVGNGKCASVQKSRLTMTCGLVSDEPAWARGGTYQVVRLIRMLVEF